MGGAWAPSCVPSFLDSFVLVSLCRATFVLWRVVVCCDALRVRALPNMAPINPFVHPPCTGTSIGGGGEGGGGKEKTAGRAQLTTPRAGWSAMGSPSPYTS